MIFKMILFSLLIFASGNTRLSTVQFSNGVKLKVEIAKDFDSRAQGLMGRTSLDKNSGMLFEFEEPQRLSFWMKDTYVALSIGYFDVNKVLKEVYDMAPQMMLAKEQNLQNYPSRCHCKYAIEVNQGWFKKNKIKIGDKFSL